MSHEFEVLEPEEKKTRPGFLTVLGILSFISIGMNLALLLFQLISGKPSEGEMLQEKVALSESITEMEDLGMDSFAEFFEKAQAMSEQFNERFYIAISISILTYLIGLFGVIRMWKGHKLGFHLYIIYSLLAIGGVYLYISPANVPALGVIINAVISGIFIFMYSRNLKWMK